MGDLKSAVTLLGAHGRGWFIAFVAITLLTASAASRQQSYSEPHASIYSLSNLMGQATYSLTHHDGLHVRSDAMGTPDQPIDFYAARMPLPILVLSAISTVAHSTQQSIVGLIKSVMFLLPAWLAVALLMRERKSLAAPWISLAAFAPFLMTPFLADVANDQVEEGYAYSLIALAFTLCALSIVRAPQGAIRWIVLGASVAAIYLTKSSLLPLCFILAATPALFGEGPVTRRLTPVALLAAAVAGWVFYTYSQTGHASLGTSLDGMNLHKGNNPTFLDHYPPPPGSDLDQYDSDLNIGRTFSSEWDFDAFHKRAAVAFILGHPIAAAQGLLWKLFEFFLSIQKIGSSPSHGLRGAWETLSLFAFRLASVTTMAASATLVFAPAGRSVRGPCALYLMTCAAVAAPYALGFCYTRHVSVLIMPTTLMMILLADRLEWGLATWTERIVTFRREAPAN